jgi:hypothetical protein
MNVVAGCDAGDVRQDDTEGIGRSLHLESSMEQSAVEDHALPVIPPLALESAMRDSENTSGVDILLLLKASI